MKLFSLFTGLFLILSATWPTLSQASESFRVTDPAQIERVLAVAPELAQAVVAYHAVHGFTPIRSVDVSSITLERDESTIDEIRKFTNCDYTFVATLQNGAQLTASHETEGDCR